MITQVCQLTLSTIFTSAQSSIQSNLVIFEVSIKDFQGSLSTFQSKRLLVSV
jgi:hypothetical protein